MARKRVAGWRARLGAGLEGRTALAVLLGGVALASCLTPGGRPIETERELLQSIATSNTAEDHEALAAFYREEAAALEEKAAQHEQRAERYARIPRRQGRAGFLRCRALADSYRQMAAEERALADLHAGRARELRGTLPTEPG